MIHSIVIPLYNNVDTIERSLESCVNQIVLPAEIIIVDDKSSDDSLKVVNKWIDRYKGDVDIVLDKLELNSGSSVARNRGWDISRGEYISFLDADDFFLVDKLKNIVSILSNNSDILLLAHNYALVHEKKQNNSKTLNLIIV